MTVHRESDAASDIKRHGYLSIFWQPQNIAKPIVALSIIIQAPDAARGAACSRGLYDLVVVGFNVHNAILRNGLDQHTLEVDW